MTTPVHLSRPDGPARGGVVVLQEAFGVNAHIRDVCDRFAAAGWTAASPHLYHRTGDPQLAYADVTATREHALALTGDGLREDIGSALDAVTGPGAAPAVVGFCMGGSLALWTAVSLPVSCAVTFYGGGVTTGRFGGVPPLVELAPQLTVPWLGLYGALDAHIPLSDVDALRSAAAGAKVPGEVLVYDDAGHGFHCDARSDYRPAAAADAWRRMLALMDANAVS